MSKPTVAIEIPEGIEGEPTSKTVTVRATGEQVTFYEQRVYYHIDGVKYPLSGTITINDNVGYNPGLYRVEGTSWVVSRYGELGMVKNPHLTPLKEGLKNVA